MACTSPERGARLARREERAYWAYVSDEQRSQTGCPARGLCESSRFQGTSSLVEPGLQSLRRPDSSPALRSLALRCPVLRCRRCPPLTLLPCVTRSFSCPGTASA